MYSNDFLHRNSNSIDNTKMEKQLQSSESTCALSVQDEHAELNNSNVHLNLYSPNEENKSKEFDQNSCKSDDRNAYDETTYKSDISNQFDQVHISPVSFLLNEFESIISVKNDIKVPSSLNELNRREANRTKNEQISEIDQTNRSIYDLFASFAVLIRSICSNPFQWSVDFLLLLSALALLVIGKSSTNDVQSMSLFAKYSDDLQKAEPNFPIIIASTPREPVSCSKQWTTAAISLLTTCRSPMDNRTLIDEKCSINQLNELGEKNDQILDKQNSGEKLNDTLVDKSIEQCLNDESTRYQNRPKPQKRYSIIESKNGLFRLRTAKDVLDRVTKKVMNSECKGDLMKDNNIKNRLTIKTTTNYNQLTSDLNATTLNSEQTGDLRLEFNGRLQNNSGDYIQDLKLDLANYSTNDEEIIDDHSANKSSFDDYTNSDLNVTIMPEPLFTELELDELCNRSLNCSSNSSNSSIDCKQSSVVEHKNESNTLNEFTDQTNQVDVKVDKGVNRSNDINLNSSRDESFKSLEQNKDVQIDQQSKAEQDKHSIIVNQQVNDLDRALSEDVSNDENSIKSELKNLPENVVSTNNRSETGVLEMMKDVGKVKSYLENLANQSNRTESTKTRIDQLIDNCLNKRLDTSLLGSSTDQFNFEQQTDNLVEEMYFTAELGDQQKSVQINASSGTIDDRSSISETSVQNRSEPEKTLEQAKTSSVSITKIQVYSQQSVAAKSNCQQQNTETDHFELQSNSSAESLSKYPDDGVEMMKGDEEEEKIDSEDVCKSSVKSVDSGTSSCSVTESNQEYLVVCAIDFGSTYSGYAFSFVRETNDQQIHMMRNPIESNNLSSHKTPTALLLTPNGNFHSFGSLAKETYHNLSNEQASKWLFFDKFKMTLHRFCDSQELTKHTTIKAANGVQIQAITVFSMALRYFKQLAIEQLEQQCGIKFNDTRYNNVVKYVITVPAIYKSPAKQFMRLAAYQAGLANEKRPNQLVIALEPEAASLYCRRLKLNQLANETTGNKQENNLNLEKSFKKGCRYVVVDCGGGTVDITVHEVEIKGQKGRLKEIYYGGGAFGSLQIDHQFELVLMRIFGQEFIEKYKLKCPSGWIDLMNSFEARKRTATITHNQQALLNITLPFSFINQVKKPIDQYLKRFYNSNRDFVSKDEITYCSKLGMIRLQPSFMYKLFRPITNEIVEHIRQIIMNDDVNNDERPLCFLFLVGGFAESQIVQHIVRSTFDCQFQTDSPICLNKITVDDTDDKLVSTMDRETFDRLTIDKLNVDQQQQVNKSINKLNETKHSNSPSKDVKSKDAGSVFKRSLNKLIKLDNSKSIKVNSSVGIDVLAKSVSLMMTQKANSDLKKKCQYLKVIIPQEVSSAILKGAVIYGLDPNVITVRRSRLTYGIGILNRFQPDEHPQSKLIVRDGIQWCTDIFDKFVVCDQAIALNECVQRTYTPAKQNQKTSILNIYCSASENVKFVTDPGVSLCGRLVLDLDVGRSDSSALCDENTNSGSNEISQNTGKTMNNTCTSSTGNTTNNKSERSSPETNKSENTKVSEFDDEQTREIITKMVFGSTEISISAVDGSTGKQVKAEIDFLMR